MEYLQIKTLKKQVEYILHNHPETRDSDAELVTILCGKFGLDPIKRASSIERCRRWYQQRHKYLPKLEQTVRQRGMNADEWRVSMGYPTQQGGYTPPSVENVVARLRSKNEPGVFYYVRKTDSGYTCSCKAFEFGHGEECKHINFYLQSKVPKEPSQDKLI